MQIPLIRLQCGCRSYEWGKIGKDSAAARYASATPSTNFAIKDDEPYAELWMGTHPSAPSRDVESHRSLLELVEDNQALMSIEISEKYGKKLPFLFKVLSIHKPLSIQAHPNKKLAEKLRQSDPEHYPDDNHKPEMVIAITTFDGLCGFRPLEEICYFLKNVAPLRKMVTESKSSEFINTVSGQETTDDTTKTDLNKKALRSLFTTLMGASTETLRAASQDLVQSASSSPSTFAGGDVNNPTTSTASELASLIIRLNSYYPSDIGLFAFFFLNYVTLEPGESMFLQADDVHAYLSGDVIECMASSDNVVRAGFTPKFKDVSTLTSMLTYGYAPVDQQKLHPEDYPYVTLNAMAYSSNSSSLLYDPPIEEFSVVKTELSKSGAKATFEAIAGPSIILCTQGEGIIKVGPKIQEIKTGFVYFVGATAECVIENKSEDIFVTFKAFCELEGKQTVQNGGA